MTGKSTTAPSYIAMLYVQCKRCGYEWIPESTLYPSRKPPKRCARDKCRSPYWDQPRRNKKKEKTAR